MCILTSIINLFYENQITPSNISAHLDTKVKQNSANILSGILIAKKIYLLVMK